MAQDRARSYSAGSTAGPGATADLLGPQPGRIEAALARLAAQQTVKDLYTTAEVAGLLNKAEFTVREGCRLGRVQARKRPCGRGRTQERVIPHAELQRLQNEGLLPAEH